MQKRLGYKIGRLWMVVLLVIVSKSLRGNNNPKLEFQEKWGSVFGGSELELNVEISCPEAFSGKLGWSLKTKNRTLIRREVPVLIEHTGRETVTLKIAAPEVKEGVNFSAILSLELTSQQLQRIVAKLEKKLTIFSENPFSNRRIWLTNLEIRLYDPKGRAATAFEKLEIPFERIHDVERVSDIENGTLVVGPDSGICKNVNIFNLFINAATHGCNVLCLSQEDGEVSFPGGSNTESGAPIRVEFRKNDIVGELDSRLDKIAWQPDNMLIKSRLHFICKDDQSLIAINSDQNGWPWSLIEFESGGKFIFCGFDLIGKWDAGPDPRYFFIAAIELMGKK